MATWSACLQVAAAREVERAQCEATHEAMRAREAERVAARSAERKAAQAQRLAKLDAARARREALSSERAALHASVVAHNLLSPTSADQADAEATGAAQEDASKL